MFTEWCDRCKRFTLHNEEVLCIPCVDRESVVVQERHEQNEAELADYLQGYYEAMGEDDEPDN